MTDKSDTAYHNLPLISVITATLNVDDCFIHTVNSMRNQLYRNIEWIVIDGASRDGTIELLKNNSNVIHYWSSEPDHGIYDAWNKGLKIATGDFVCFLGAGDCWAAPDSLKKLVECYTGTEDMVSARFAVVSSRGKVIRTFGEQWSKTRMDKKQVVAHPGMLFNIKLFKEYGVFDSSYVIAGDYEWMLRLKDSMTVAFIQDVTVLMKDQGISERKLFTALTETRAAQKRHVKTAPIKRELHFLVYALRIIGGKIFRSLSLLT